MGHPCQTYLVTFMFKIRVNQMTKVSKREKSMIGEFDQTRAFLRQCMAGVVTGEINHQAAKDVAMLAQAQNYNMALEANMFPKHGRGESSQKLLNSASVLAGE